jgi:hypothetical protein
LWCFITTKHITGISQAQPITLVIAVVNHTKRHDWGVQVENESGGDMTISIVYHLIEKNGSKLQNCLVNSRVG